MARSVANGSKEQHWRQVLARWRSSGLSVRAYCELQRIPQPSFYWWRRAISRRDSAGPQFRPVRVVPDAVAPDVGDGAIEVILLTSAAFGSGQASIELPSFVSSTTWRTEASHVDLACHGAHLACAQPTDLRKSFDSLAAIVRDALGGDPLSGNVFVFRNQAADRIKLLVWEADGYAIWYKRLEIGTFRFPAAGYGSPQVEIRAADLIMLLAGVDISSVKRSKRYHRPVPSRIA